MCVVLLSVMVAFNVTPSPVPRTDWFPAEVSHPWDNASEDASIATLQYAATAQADSGQLSDFKLLIQFLTCVFVAAVLAMSSVTIVLVFTVKRLQLLIGVLRTETRTEGVRAGLLEADVNAAMEGGVEAVVSAATSGSAQKNGGARAPPKNKSARKTHTDTENTSCAIHEVDEEEDHRL